jgi:hypothetical protein
VSIWEPSAAAVFPSPHMAVTSSLLKALMTVADAFSIFAAVACLLAARVSSCTLTWLRMCAATWAGPSGVPCANTVSTYRASVSRILGSDPEAGPKWWCQPSR